MTDLRKIAAAMGGEVNGNVAAFPTPGHSKADRGSWASIVPGAPDGVLINSRNGGDPLAIKDELRAKGVLPSRETTLRTRDVAAWEYADADGVTLYRKVRMTLPNGSKSYRFEHPDGRGGWKPKRGDAPQVPYRLPDILAAEHAAILYMAEGEKQADKLASWGFLATSSKDWRGFDFCGYVKGRTVVILPDNDAEGERIAGEAKASVERANGRAVILNLPGLPPKGDVMDWTGDAVELRTLTEEALRQPAEIFPIADLLAWARSAPEPKAFTMAGYVPAGEVTLFTGAGGTNKSTFGLQLCAASAAGGAMLGTKVAPGAALYVTAEDEDRENHWRLGKIAFALDTTLERLAGGPVAGAPAGTDAGAPWGMLCRRARSGAGGRALPHGPVLHRGDAVDGGGGERARLAQVDRGASGSVDLDGAHQRRAQGARPGALVLDRGRGGAMALARAVGQSENRHGEAHARARRHHLDPSRRRSPFLERDAGRAAGGERLCAAPRRAGRLRAGRS